MIVAKWDNGTPKKVNYVVGEGVKQEIVGRINYYENGEIEIKGEYEKGKKHGKHEYYDENGQIIKEETYKDGKLNGKFTGWYDSGQKRIAGSYKDGKHTGIWKSWDLLGIETSAADWLQKGDDAYNNKEYDEAIRFYSRNIELKPDNAVAYYNMGMAYTGRIDYTKAIQSYEKAIELKPDSPLSYYNMGHVYSKLDKPELRILNYKKAANLGQKGAQDWLKKKGYDW